VPRTPEGVNTIPAAPSSRASGCAHPQKKSAMTATTGSCCDDLAQARIGSRSEARAWMKTGKDSGAHPLFGVLDARGKRRVGRERDGERVDGGWLHGEERGEEREVGGRGDDGEAEAARGEEGGQVEERQRVALRGEGDDEHVRPGGRCGCRLHG